MTKLCALCGKSPANSPQAKLCSPCSNTLFECQKAVQARVHKAIREGLLPRADSFSCVDCGKQAQGYDHRDYNKPMDVEPVCRSCNAKRGPGIPAELEPPKQRLCETCGADVSDRHRLTRFCSPCAEQRQITASYRSKQKRHIKTIYHVFASVMRGPQKNAAA